MQRKGRVTLSVRLQREVVVAMKSFVDDNRGKPLRLTVASFVEAAIEHHLRSEAQRLAALETGHQQIPGANHVR